MRSAPEIGDHHPDDWGIPYADPRYTDVWRDTGGTGRVIDEMLDGFNGADAGAQIAAVHGRPDERARLLATLRAYADEHPECSGELRRFANQTDPGPGPQA